MENKEKNSAVDLADTKSTTRDRFWLHKKPKTGFLGSDDPAAFRFRVFAVFENLASVHAEQPTEMTTRYISTRWRSM